MSEPSKPSFFKDPQNIIAVGVTIISLCALMVSLVQTNLMREESALMREHSRASVWPRLEFTFAKGHSRTDGSINKFVFQLTNSGVGPAIITDVVVRHKGQVAEDWWDLFDLHELPDSIETHITNINFNGRIIKIGETVDILKLDDNLPLAQAFYERLAHLSLDIYYESIYGESWKYELGESGENTIKLEDFAGLPEEEQFGN